MSKRTNSIVAVTVAAYATIYVEAETPQEAAEIVKGFRKPHEGKKGNKNNRYCKKGE